MTPQEAVDIARGEIREAFFRTAGQIHDYDIGIRAWVWALTEALETTLTAAEDIRRGKVTREDLAESLKRLAVARARYTNGA